MQPSITFIWEDIDNSTSNSDHVTENQNNNIINQLGEYASAVMNNDKKKIKQLNKIFINLENNKKKNNDFWAGIFNNISSNIKNPNNLIKMSKSDRKDIVYVSDNDEYYHSNKYCIKNAHPYK